MGGLFSKPKPIVMPEIEEPPEIVSEAIKGPAKSKKRKGRAETIVTGELEPTGAGKTILG